MKNQTYNNYDNFAVKNGLFIWKFKISKMMEPINIE